MPIAECVLSLSNGASCSGNGKTSNLCSSTSQIRPHTASAGAETPPVKFQNKSSVVTWMWFSYSYPGCGTGCTNSSVEEAVVARAGTLFRGRSCSNMPELVTDNALSEGKDTTLQNEGEDDILNNRELTMLQQGTPFPQVSNDLKPLRPISQGASIRPPQLLPHPHSPPCTPQLRSQDYCGAVTRSAAKLYVYDMSSSVRDILAGITQCDNVPGAVLKHILHVTQLLVWCFVRLMHQAACALHLLAGWMEYLLLVTLRDSKQQTSSLSAKLQPSDVFANSGLSPPRSKTPVETRRIQPRSSVSEPRMRTSNIAAATSSWSHKKGDSLWARQCAEKDHIL